MLKFPFKILGLFLKLTRSYVTKKWAVMVILFAICQKPIRMSSTLLFHNNNLNEDVSNLSTQMVRLSSKMEILDCKFIQAKRKL